MSVLVAFATVEGQTGKIAEFVADVARERGLDVDLLDVSELTESASFDGVDKVVLAAPVHERRHPKPFEVFVTANAKELKSCNTLMLSISLSAAFPEGMEEAEEYLVEMEMRTGLQPDAELLVAGAVRHLSYDYYATQVLRYIVLRDRDFDPSEGDREFTDWDAVRETLEKFFES